MKQKSLFALLICIIFQSATAQRCDTVTANCVPTNTLTSPGITPYTQFPCVEKGKYYTYTFELYVPNSISVAGSTINVNGIVLDSINNLPCGLCWRCNKSDRSYIGGEHGCITITGNSNDLVGTYKLELSGTAITSFGSFTSRLDYPGFEAYLRVIDTNQTCPTFDTISTKRACSLNSGCTVDGVEILQLNHPNHCLNVGDSIVIGTNIAFSSYSWEVTDFFGTPVTFNTPTINVSYNGVPVIVTFNGVLGNCTYTESFTNVDKAGLKCSPRFCYIEADTIQNNNKAKFYFQRNNTSNPLVTSFTPSKVYNNGTSTQVFLDTIAANIQGQFLDTLIEDADYSIYVNSTTCDNNMGQHFANLLNIGYFRVTNDLNGYPLLSLKMPTLNIPSFSIYKRPAGGVWRVLRTYFSTPAVVVGDNFPDSTVMEYQVVYDVNAACTPARATTQHLLYRKSTLVPDSIVVSAISDIKMKQFAIVPNPTSGLFTINGDGNTKDLNVVVFDCIGNIIFSSTGFDLKKEIDLRAFNSGMYYVKISVGRNNKYLKLIKTGN